MTSVLYLDFGDAFPAGGLNVTVDELHNDFGAGTPGIQGPNFTGDGTPALAGGDNLRFNPLSSLVNFNYNGAGGVGDAADYTDLRTAVVALVQRYYDPFDVVVQIAPALNNASSAAYLADIRSTLQMGANVDGERDVWQFVTGVVRTDTAEQMGAELGTFGTSPGNDIGGNNSRDDTAIAFADFILESIISGAEVASHADTRLAYTAAHQAAHTFGLEHTSSAGADNLQLTQSDLIVDSATSVNRTNFDFFTRFPLNTQVPPPAEVNNFSRLADSDLLGLKAAQPAYVTGTGAHDIIEITNAGGGFAIVSVTPYSDSAFTTQITVPGQAAGTPFTYAIGTANGILIEGGFGLDRFIIDASLGVNITVRGMAGFDDELIVQGGGAVSGSYTPGSAIATGLDDNTYFTGQVIVGATTIDLEEFGDGVGGSTITVQSVTNFIVHTPNGADDVAVALNNVGGNQHRVSGTSGGVPFVDLLLSGTQTLTIDAATNDTGISQHDLITVRSNGMAVADLIAMLVNTGSGDDTLTADFSTGLVRISIGYDAGSSADDNDRLVLTGNPGTAIARETYRVGATEDAGIWFVDADGSMGPGASLVPNGDELIVSFTNLEPVDTDIPAAVFDVIMNVADNQASIVDGGLLNGFNSLQVTDLNATFETFRFARKVATRIMGQSGIDTISVDYTIAADSLTTLEVHGHVAADVLGQPADDAAADVLSVLRNAAGVTHALFGEAGDDSFTIGNGDLSLILAPVTINAGDGTADALVVNDSVRVTVVDYYVDPTKISICVSPGPPPMRTDIALFDGTLEFARLDATDGINRFDVTPSTTTEFTIDGNLPPPGTPNGDFLSVRFAGTTGRTLTYDPVTGNGMWEFNAPHQDIKFESIEKINYFPVLAYGADAAAKGKPRVKVFDAETGTLLTTFLAYESSYRHGVRVAVADINGDGIPEIITAPGRNHAPLVKIYNVLTGTIISGTSFHAYSKSYINGVNLAAGDLDNDGLNDLIVAPDRGKTEIRTFFNNFDTTPAKPFSSNDMNRFLAFKKDFIGGASVAAGDVRADGKAEIIVGSGSGMRAEVRIFDGLTNGSVNTPAAFARRFFPFDAKQRGGAWVAVANIDADAKFEILVGAGIGGGSRVATHDLANLNVPVSTFTPYSGSGSNAPVRVAASDVNADGLSDLFVAQGPDGRSRKIRSGPPAGALVDFLMETDPEFLNGFFIAADVHGDVFVC